jgi:MICOS complex subunit MIC19
MGQGQSAPSGATDSTKHVFTASTPINFSSELLDSLSSSTETDSTRQKTLDLHIAQRVQEELAKLQAEQTSAIANARQKILSSDSSDGNADEDSKASGLKAKLPEKLGGTSKDEQEQKQASSKKVQEEIERLKKELGQRKVLKDLPRDVEAAREGVISCLRVNDRRPLDCWKEVEVFKREVRKMEEDFVGRIL